MQRAIVIDGRKIADSILDNLKRKIDQDPNYCNNRAKLAIILVGDNTSSIIYIKNKIKSATKVGIQTQLQQYDTNITEQELIQEIALLNKDRSVSGIIVQCPLPKHINMVNLIQIIDPSKDVDGFHPTNVGLLYSPYDHTFVPCTAAGSLHLMKHYCPDLTGKNVVIIGRSSIVGRPLAAILLKENCSVTICHSKTINLHKITSRADIVVSAMGYPKLLTKKYFNNNAMVIDVGITRIESEGISQLMGDVDFQSVKQYVKYITPVPGGVGPMTVAYLMMNTYYANSLKQGI